MHLILGQLIDLLKPKISPTSLLGLAAVPAEPPAQVDFAAHQVVVVIPAYNEERFIGSVVIKLLRYPVMVIVVDDGSSDDTALIARLAGATVVRHPVNRGKGVALNTGLRLGRQFRPSAIVTLDADGQHLPEQLARVVGPVLQGQADLVVGSRYLQSALGVPPLRRLGHRFFNRLTRLLTGVPVSDTQSGYRAFSPRAYNLGFFHCPDFSVETEMQFLARQHHLRLAEVPVTIRYTDRPKRPLWRHGLRVLNGLLRLTGQYRPLLFFGLPGLALVLLGLGAGAWVVHRYLQVRQIAIGTALGSLLLTIFGMITLSTAITLHSIRGLLIDLLASKADQKDPC
jgi:glycosyltransferase involved in cell wall biosynthesis